MALHGRNNCLINPSASAYDANVDIEAQHIYVNIFQFLSSLTGSGEVERVAYYIGHPNSGSSGNGLDFYPSANACGGNAFSVWRFVSSSARPFDFYMLFQHAGGSQANVFANTSGTYGTYDTTNFGNTPRGIVAWQIACSYDPTTKIASNPWNGSVNNDGTDFKGTPTWVTGSSGHTLAVLPAHNDFRVNKDHLGVFYFRANIATVQGGELNIGAETGSDNDGFWLNYYRTFTTNYAYQSPAMSGQGYIGTYIPRSELTGAVVPLVGFGSNTLNNSTNLFVEGVSSFSQIRSGAAGIWLSSSAFTLCARNVSNTSEYNNYVTYTPYSSNTFIHPQRKTVFEVAPIALIASTSVAGQNGAGFVGYLSKNIGEFSNVSSWTRYSSTPTSLVTTISNNAIVFARSGTMEDSYFGVPTSISGSITY